MAYLMKILIVMAGFFPGKKYGGPPVSVDNFCSLMNEYECYIVTKNHDKGSSQAYEGIKSNSWIKRDNCHVQYLCEGDYCATSFLRISDEIKPDIIYLQGLFQACVLPCLRIAKKRGIKVLLAPRGELCKGAFRKKYKKIPYIIYLKSMRLLDTVSFQSTSEEETECIKKYLGVTTDRVFSLTNIPSIPTREYDLPQTRAGSAKLIFLSRIHPKKNLLSAIQYLNGVAGNVQFDIYGPKEDQEYWKQCEEAIDKLPDNIRVQYCGLLSHGEVHAAFSRYDAFLFPTLSENYGHVIAEALFVGCPVIISDQTPWNDVNDYGSGWAIPLEETNQFIAAIQAVVDADNNDMRTKVKQYVVDKTRIGELQIMYQSALCSVAKK